MLCTGMEWNVCKVCRHVGIQRERERVSMRDISSCEYVSISAHNVFESRNGFSLLDLTWRYVLC